MAFWMDAYCKWQSRNSEKICTGNRLYKHLSKKTRLGVILSKQLPSSPNTPDSCAGSCITLYLCSFAYYCLNVSSHWCQLVTESDWQSPQGPHSNSLEKIVSPVVSGIMGLMQQLMQTVGGPANVYQQKLNWVICSLQELSIKNIHVGWWVHWHRTQNRILAGSFPPYKYSYRGYIRAAPC